MANTPETTPVIIGVGQINDRPETPEAGLEPHELMAEALKLADADAGGGWLGDCDSLAVVDQFSMRNLNPVIDTVAQLIGADPAHREQTAMPNGDSPILLLNKAANMIGAGEAKICAITGGEALRTAAHRAAAKAKTSASEQNAMRKAASGKAPGYRQTYGLAVPVDVYPLYENAARAAWGQSLAQGQSESAQIWSQFSQIAADNDAAWLRKRVSAQDIATPDANNRPIAFPYTKLTVANSSVNQGAGFIVTSLAEAERRGVPADKIIHVGFGAAAHEPDDFLGRDTYASSPSMAVSLEKCLALNGMEVGDFAFAELYSCFPCVPKMARRVIGWPVDRPATVFGGLTFGGGPIGNYMSHAVASMVDALRRENGNGLLFANGGFATHNHTIVLSSNPLEHAQFPQDFDFQAEADQRRGPVPDLDKAYSGPATVETYTVHYKRDGSPRVGTIVAKTPDGARTLARVDASDEALITFLTDGTHEPVGSAGHVVPGGDGAMRWERA